MSIEFRTSWRINTSDDRIIEIGTNDEYIGSDLVFLNVFTDSVLPFDENDRPRGFLFDREEVRKMGIMFANAFDHIDKLSGDDDDDQTTSG